MKIFSAIPVALVLSLTTFTAHAAEPPGDRFTPLFQHELPNAAGKTFTTGIVTLAPGAQAAPHRHGQAFVYAYVLEGAVRSQLGDGPAQTFTAGQNWFEPPGAHHLLTENPSASTPSRLLVVFVSDTGEPLKTDDMDGH